ncbi:hypothetical protein KSP39_PZI016208 [Platanthera zijinensis]|uniref:Uncharacterized protein n=1 Tax=Platanthera zijinensis TaxID=2320716 RepID=A0AAP0B642_9ASPA
MRHVPSLLYDQRHQSARERRYSSSGKVPSTDRTLSSEIFVNMLRGFSLRRVTIYIERGIDLRKVSIWARERESAVRLVQIAFFPIRIEGLPTYMIDRITRGGQLDAGEELFCGVFVCDEWGLFLVEKFASALLKDVVAVKLLGKENPPLLGDKGSVMTFRHSSSLSNDKFAVAADHDFLPVFPLSFLSHFFDRKERERVSQPTSLPLASFFWTFLRSISVPSAWTELYETRVSRTGRKDEEKKELKCLTLEQSSVHDFLYYLTLGMDAVPKVTQGPAVPHFPLKVGFRPGNPFSVIIWSKKKGEVKALWHRERSLKGSGSTHLVLFLAILLLRNPGHRASGLRIIIMRQ